MDSSKYKNIQFASVNDTAITVLNILTALQRCFNKNINSIYEDTKTTTMVSSKQETKLSSVYNIYILLRPARLK